MPTPRADKTLATDTGASFRGWPAAAVEFLEQIEIDNTKTFWTAKKQIYETKVLAPMQALLAELTPEFGEGRVMRPYRDTRFSADKSPYKTSIAAHNGSGYISLSARALGVGAGLYMPSAEQLARYRAAVDAERTGEELTELVRVLRSKGIDVSAHEVLKTAPRGYSADHPRIELLRHKGLTAWREWPIGAWLGTAAAKKRVEQFLRDAAPLRAWFELHAGVEEA
jgi:uncharacterized protein (TIGR02453 family)